MDSRNDSPATLDYARPATRPPLTPAWKTSALRSARNFALMQVVLFCITVGLSATIGRRFYSELGLAGLLTLIMDLPLLLAAAVTLLVFTAARWADATDRRAEIVVPGLVALGLNVAPPLISILLILCDGGIR